MILNDVDRLDIDTVVPSSKRIEHNSIHTRTI